MASYIISNFSSKLRDVFASDRSLQVTVPVTYTETTLAFRTLFQDHIYSKVFYCPLNPHSWYLLTQKKRNTCSEIWWEALICCFLYLCISLLPFKSVANPVPSCHRGTLQRTTVWVWATPACQTAFLGMGIHVPIGKAPKGTACSPSSMPTELCLPKGVIFLIPMGLWDYKTQEHWGK